MIRRAGMPNLSAEPILAAAEAYRGTIVDLDQSLTVSSESLAIARGEICDQLRRSGVRPGDRIVLAVGNGPLFMATLTGVLAAGGSPLLTHASTPPAELKRTALRFGARFIVRDQWDVAEARDGDDDVRAIESAEPWVRLFYLEVDRSSPEFQARYPALPSVPLHPTSGTTGQPKVAVRPGESAIAEAQHYIDTIGIDGGDTLLSVAPMSHAYAYGMCVMVPLVSGANVVTMRQFSQSLVFRALAEQDITVLPAVPAMLDVLMFGAGKRLENATKTVLTAGAPLPARTAERFQRASGITVRPLYGTTETGGISVADESAKVFGAAVGRPMAGVDAYVATDERTAGLGDQVGRLQIRSSSMMAGYLCPDGIDTSPLNDGWFDTGDLSWLGADGAIHLKGRETEVINVGGMKVVPSEVEDVIGKLPGVNEVKVYPGSNAAGSQFVKAAVVAPQLDADTIRSHCEQELVYFKRPHPILFVDRLPRSPAGKIVMDRLP
jgi:acyl-CoA synthetase (AMP-forming)/AMP-acid ligase II